MRRHSIKEQLEAIARLAGKVDPRTGMLVHPGKPRANPAKLYKKITLFALFVSDEDTFLIRPHIFKSNDGRNAAEWREWFRKNYTSERPSDGEPGILANILGGISRRSGGEKHWRVARIIGWSPNDRSRIIHTEKPKARNKAKQKRR